MEQITKQLIAMIKPGHGALEIGLDIVDNESDGLIISLNESKTKFIPNNKFQQFLDECIGGHILNNDWTIIFEDSRDYMQYILAMDDCDTWVK